LTLAHLGYVKEKAVVQSDAAGTQLAAAYLGESGARFCNRVAERLAAEYGDTFSVAVVDGDSAVMIAYATPRRCIWTRPALG